MLDRGKLAVLTIIAVATLAAGLAWWFNFQRGQRALEIYGTQAALLIRTAPQVELLEIAGDPAVRSDSLGDVQIGQKSVPIARRTDISRAPGLVHARTALLDDASYEWDAAISRDGEVPVVAGKFVRFSAGPREVVLRFDLDGRQVTVCATGATARLKAKTSDGWHNFLGRNSGGRPTSATE